MASHGSECEQPPVRPSPAGKQLAGSDFYYKKDWFATDLYKLCLSLKKLDWNTMNTNRPVDLYTATGVFKGDSAMTIEVNVPNFSTREDAEAYAMAFQIKLVDGKLYRDDGKGTGIFDESWREVPDSQITVSQENTEGIESRPPTIATLQRSSVPALRGDFTLHAWHVKQDTI